MKLSLKNINIVLFLALFTINIVSFIFPKYVEIFLIINISTFILFLILNILFYKDYNKIIKSNKELYKINEDYIDIKKMWRNSFFVENNELEKIIKKYIFKTNLQKKNFLELRETFKKFLPKELYDEIWEKWYERITLGNFKIKNIAIMFIDIAWFTSMSEKMKPERALLLLNVYFDWIWEIVLKNKWYIDKFLWDWIMVVFEDNNIDNCVKSAIEIQKLISKFKIWDIWEKIDIWIWINYWEVIAWTIWTKTRMEATYIWDTINTASRIEWLTRIYKKNIIISKELNEKIKNRDIFEIKYLWKEKLKWKNKETEIYEIEPNFKN